MKLPFQDADPAHDDFQYLEDLATAYWYSEVLFAALELGLFQYLDRNGCDLDTLAQSAACHKTHLKRLLIVLERLELVDKAGGKWFNSQAAGTYLVPGKPSYMGDFLIYRRYIQPRWQEIIQKVSLDPDRFSLQQATERDYAGRTLEYVRGLNALAREKARDIKTCLASQAWNPPVLDIGGGAGALSRALIGSKPGGQVFLFELPEVIQAAKSLYPDAGDWKRFTILTGDFRTHAFENQAQFGLVILGNFLHAYGCSEARELLLKALGLLAPDGLLLIHDYFPDRLGRSPQKGPLYDLNMLLNTYNGACHDSSQILEWLQAADFTQTQILDLSTDSSIITARRTGSARQNGSLCEDWPEQARKLGFRTGVWLAADEVVTAPWVRLKCRCGCPVYGKNLQCPPHGIESAETRKLLQSYTRILLLEGAPPGPSFHNRLLKIERAAFLRGYHKALVLGAGPCPVCKICPGEENCRHPQKARPSMEASGIDVFTTVQNAGIHLKPLTQKGRYVKYFGLLLLE